VVGWSVGAECVCKGKSTRETDFTGRWSGEIIQTKEIGGGNRKKGRRHISDTFPESYKPIEKGNRGGWEEGWELTMGEGRGT